MTQFVEGLRVAVVEKNEQIDEAVVRSFISGTNGDFDEIHIESLSLHPGVIRELIQCSGRESEGREWAVIFKDPFTDSRCYSQRGPTFDIRPL